MAEVIVSLPVLEGAESSVRKVDHLHSNTLDTTARILRQMERYLSDENLLRDRLLQKYLLLDETQQGYIPLDLFSSFAKIKKITTEQDVFRDALKKSDSLVLNNEGTHVRRKVPLVLPTKTLKWNNIQKNAKSVKEAGSEESSIKSSTETDTVSESTAVPPTSTQASSLCESQNQSDVAPTTPTLTRSEETPTSPPVKAVNIIESNTIYVSHIPKNSDKNSLVSIFSICGSITRIDIPLDKKSGNSKGITFIEYQTEEQAKKAIEHFNTPDNIAFQLGIRVKPYKMGLKNNAGKSPTPTSSSESSSAPSSTDLVNSTASETSESDSPFRRQSIAVIPDSSLPNTPVHFEVPEFQRSASLGSELNPKTSVEEIEKEKKKRKRGKKKSSLSPTPQSAPDSPMTPIQFTSRPPSAPSDMISFARSQSDAQLRKPVGLSESQPIAMPTTISREWNSTNSLLSSSPNSKFANFHKSRMDLPNSPPSKSSFASSMPIIPSYGNRDNYHRDSRRGSLTGALSPTHEERQRPILFQRASFDLHIIPIRQPKGPDGTKGFMGRGRLVKL